MAVAAAEAQPILPPRPTGRSPTIEPTASGWRSWPVVVIVLAVAAIIVAVVLMVWPATSNRAGAPAKRALQPPPAPERMPTEPDRKPAPDRRRLPTVPHAQTAPDPWESSPDRPQRAPAPSPPDDDDLGALMDMLLPPSGSAGAPGLGFTQRRGMFSLMSVHLCRKLITCRVDDAMAKDICDKISHPPPPPPSSCPAAARCLQEIDAMSCDSQAMSFSQLLRVMSTFEACIEASGC